MTSVSAVVSVGLAVVALVGVAIAAVCYTLVPWERVVDEDETPEGVSAVRLARLGTTLGFLSLVPVALGEWAQFATIAAPSRVTGAEPKLAERVAFALPGEAIVVGSLVCGFAAVLAPMWVPLAVRGRAMVAS